MTASGRFRPSDSGLDRTPFVRQSRGWPNCPQLVFRTWLSSAAANRSMDLIKDLASELKFPGMHLLEDWGQSGPTARQVFHRCVRAVQAIPHSRSALTAGQTPRNQTPGERRRVPSLLLRGCRRSTMSRSPPSRLQSPALKHLMTLPHEPEPILHRNPRRGRPADCPPP